MHEANFAPSRFAITLLFCFVSRKVKYEQVREINSSCFKVHSKDAGLSMSGFVKALYKYVCVTLINVLTSAATVSV